MADHDHSYKLLFAHPQMVRDLLEYFVGGDWLSALDLSTLERVSDSYVSDDLRCRADDIVWRVRCEDYHLYLLIDEGSYGDSELARHRNLVALLFRLENCRQRDRLEELVSTLVNRLVTEQDSLRRAFAVWLDRVILARLPGERAITTGDLREKQAMLSETFDRWEEELRQEGREEGREAGRREGEATLLIRQLQKRFGELPDSVRAHLRDAQAAQLEHWGEQLLDAMSLGDLFSNELPPSSKTANTATRG